MNEIKCVIVCDYKGRYKQCVVVDITSEIASLVLDIGSQCEM